LPGGGLHPLESAAFARRTPATDIRGNGRARARFRSSEHATTVDAWH
jgi:hypothetical protein